MKDIIYFKKVLVNKNNLLISKEKIYKTNLNKDSKFDEILFKILY